jgi:hypothetical protein
VSATRWAHSPREAEEYQAKQDAEAHVAADLVQDLHSTEVMAAHSGRPTPAEAVARGVTPASGSGSAA